MLELALTTKCCQRIIKHLLRQRGWSIVKISRTIRAPVNYVRRVEAGQQSFQLADVELIAKARNTLPSILIHQSIDRNELSEKGRKLHDMASAAIVRQEEFGKEIIAKPAKKRRASANAA